MLENVVALGKWSQFVGETFLDWLAPQSGLRWLDVGCGNGAFTEMLIDRCAPASVQGIDPSVGQLAFARTRPASRMAKFRQGDAMALPFPGPAKGVAEMARVVYPGGTISAYAWDLPGVETREITVQRTFADFDDYWTTIFGSPSAGSKLAAMASEDLAALKERMKARLPADATGRIALSALANAIKGRAQQYR